MDIVVVYESSYGNSFSMPASRVLACASVRGPADRKSYGAAFDTRVDGSPMLTGRASKGISKQLRRHGFREITDPVSFLVTKETELAAGQEDAARQWGASLSTELVGAPDPQAHQSH